MKPPKRMTKLLRRDVAGSLLDVFPESDDKAVDGIRPRRDRSTWRNDRAIPRGNMHRDRHFAFKRAAIRAFDPSSPYPRDKWRRREMHDRVIPVLENTGAARLEGLSSSDIHCGRDRSLPPRRNSEIADRVYVDEQERIEVDDPRIKSLERGRELEFAGREPLLENGQRGSVIDAGERSRLGDSDIASCVNQTPQHLQGDERSVNRKNDTDIVGRGAQTRNDPDEGRALVESVGKDWEGQFSALPNPADRNPLVADLAK